ncbi:MAG: hypothetical protein KAG61_13190 [Bacteriovoracaceae bacterium]|nr:hypothetical protein [Bacteriovoracaceae bacterium]
MEGENIKWIYFQYQETLQLPVFIRLNPAQFEESLEPFIVSMGFYKISDEAGKKAQIELNFIDGGKMLTITEASMSVARQIESIAESDRYGLESVTPKTGYRVYRYKGTALLIYSLAASEWSLGVYSDFGSPEKELDSRIVIGRYLGWALAPLGIIGMWGTPVDEGIVAMRANKSNGEFIHIDIKSRQIITLEGTKKMKPIFTIMRLDSSLKGRNVRMKNEEFLSFILHHSTFFDYSGPTVAVRQMAQLLVKTTEGIFHPEESYRPRTNLSL